MSLMLKAALWAQPGMSLAPHGSWHGAAGGGLGALAAHSPAYKPPVVAATPGAPATAAGIQQTMQQQAAQHGPQAPKIAAEGGHISKDPVKMPPIKPFRMQGEEAWNALKKSDAWLSLSPFAQGFFSKCIESAVSESEIRNGIAKAAAFDPAITVELTVGLQKLAGLGNLFGRALSGAKGLGQAAAGSVGRAVPQLARAAPGVQALGALPSTGSIPGAAVNFAQAPGMFGRAVSGARQGMANFGQAAIGNAPGGGPSSFGQGMGPLARAGIGAGAGLGADWVGRAATGGEMPGYGEMGASAAVGAGLGLHGGRAFRMMGGPVVKTLGAVGGVGGSMALGGNLVANQYQNEMSNQFASADNKWGVPSGTMQQIGKDPANIGKMPPEVQQALAAAAQKHMPGAHPMAGLNEMLNKIPWLGEQQFWQTMHPGGKLMALAGLLGAGGGAMSGNGMMAGAGGLAAIAPFIYHMMANNGGQPQAAPAGGPQVPGVGPGAPAGAMQAEGGPPPGGAPAAPPAPPARPAPQMGDWAGAGGPQQTQFLDQRGGQLPVPQAIQ